MEPLQHDGIWWDPREPHERWVGTLRFDEHDGVSLTLTVPAEKPDLSPPLRTYDLILRMAPSGKLFTLIGCFDRSTHGSLFGVPRTVEIHANARIVGFHCDAGDPLLSAVSVSFLHANEWRGRSGIESDPTVKWPDFAARYTSTEPVLLHDDGIFRITLRSSVGASIGNHQSTPAWGESPAAQICNNDSTFWISSRENPASDRRGRDVGVSAPGVGAQRVDAGGRESPPRARDGTERKPGTRRGRRRATGSCWPGTVSALARNCKDHNRYRVSGRDRYPVA
jgi:hypothetical protein